MVKRLSSGLWVVPFLCFILGYYLAHNFFHTKEIATPNFIGKKLSSVAKKASLVGLNIRIIREKEDLELGSGVVLDQIPSSGQMIKPNQHIFLTISKLPKGIVAPSFCGLKNKQILEKSKETRVPVKIFWLESDRPANFSIGQSPEPGISVLKNNKNYVSVFLSSGKSDLVVFPSLIGALLKDAKEFLVEEGVRVELIHKNIIDNRIDSNHKCDKCVITDHKPMPGSIVDKSSKLYVQLQVEHVR